MNFDAFTISALVDELLDTVAGGRIQDVLDVDETSIGLEIYAGHTRHYLLLSASAQNPRIHLVPEKLRRGLPQPTPLGLLLRRHAEGGRIGHVYQPLWERVLVIEIESPEGPLSIIGELMERRSNLLLVSEGRILDCLRRVGAHENRMRVSLPNQPYVPPPPQTGKLPPDEVDADALESMLADPAAATKKAHQLLSSRVLGISPLLGREIVFRAMGESELPACQLNAKRAADSLREITASLLARRWQPGVCEQDRRVTAFSVYPVTALPGWQPIEGVSAALSAYYSAPTGIEAYEAAKTPVRAALAEAVSKTENKLNNLRRSLKDTVEMEMLRQSGELLLAYQYTLAPGQTELCAAYEVGGPELRIAIDTALTPLENAQRYFDRYGRAKRALDDVPTLVAAAEAELATLMQLGTDCDLAANWPDIDDVQQALDKLGYWRGPAPARAGGGRSGPLRIVTPDGFVLWAGRNSRQNESVTFDKASPADWWLHARGVPGAHVIIKADGRAIPDAVFERAAALAAYYSAGRREAQVTVDVTLRKYVKRIAGAGPGMVTYRNETTRTTAPLGDVN